MKLRVSFAVLLVAALCVWLGHARAGGINKKHDFGCARCHSIHSAKGKRLWPQAPPSVTRDRTPLLASEALCYSCHGDEKQSHMFEGGFSHPINVVPSSRVKIPPELGTVFVKNVGQVITCTSCHDPHKPTDKMLKIPMEGDQLCLACHQFQ